MEHVTGAQNKAFGSYVLPIINPAQTLPLDIGANQTFVLSDWRTISKKNFSNPEINGFIKYKGPKTNIRVSVSGSMSLIFETHLNISIVKSNHPSIGNEIIPIAAVIKSPGQAGVSSFSFSGSTIFKRVKHGDYFAIIITNRNPFPSAPVITSGSLDLILV